MARQYKLRLGDGTLLAVDLVGLRAWLHDADARVQRVGSRRWRTLKDMIEAETVAAAARAAAPRPEPPPPTPAPEESVEPPTPAVARCEEPEEPAARPGANVPMLPPEALDEPPAVPVAVSAEQEIQIPAEQEIEIPADEEVAIPPEPEIAKPRPKPPIPPAPKTPIPPPPPAVVAKPAPPVAKPAPAVVPSRVAPLPVEDEPVVPLASIDLGDVARSAVTGPFAEFQSTRAAFHPARVEFPPARAEFPPPRVTRPHGADDGLPIIPLKPLDEEEEDILEELDLVEEHEPPRIPTLPPLAPIAKTLLDSASAWVSRVTAPRPPRPEPVPPPTPISELPSLRLAPLEEDRREPLVFPKRKILIGAAAIAGLALVGTTAVWVSSLGLFTRKVPPAAPAPASTPAPPEIAPPVPPELQAAVEQLPHLAPDTIRLVASTVEPGPADPPEVFRRAQLAANRGVSALAPEEAQELRSLRGSVVGALRSVDRERVLAYDRVTAGRDLLLGEDARVSRLYARGVRALSAPRRERLQVLLGKAIAASLARSAPRAEAAPRVEPGR